MNEREFKRHLKTLVEGHHHVEEHDWRQPTGAGPAAAKAAGRRSAKRGATRKNARRK